MHREAYRLHPARGDLANEGQPVILDAEARDFIAPSIDGK